MEKDRVPAMSVKMAAILKKHDTNGTFPTPPPPHPPTVRKCPYRCEQCRQKRSVTASDILGRFADTL